MPFLVAKGFRSTSILPRRKNAKGGLFGAIESIRSLGQPGRHTSLPRAFRSSSKSPPQIPASPFPPHVIPDLSTLVNVQSQDGLIPRLYHISTLVSHSNSLWLKKLEDSEVGHQVFKDKLESAEIDLEDFYTELIGSIVVEKDDEESLGRLHAKVRELNAREEELRAENNNLVDSSLGYVKAYKKALC
ncbi:hypothetical protein ACSQ67_020358 [Phaseolus vulgaris]